MRNVTGRSRFLLAAGGTMAAFRCVAAPAKAAQFEYKLGTSTDLTHPQTARLVEACAAIKNESSGRLNIGVFPNSQLGSETALLSEVRLGAIHMCSAAFNVVSSSVPIAAIGNLGFAFSNAQQALKTVDGPLGAIIRKEIVAKGLYVFERPMEAGFRQVTTSTKPIKTVDDFAGLKIRTPAAAIYVDLFKTLGASPVALESNQAYVALQTHVADAQETPLDAIDTNRFYEVQKYLSVTNHIWNGFWTIANPAAWNGLPADIQTIVNRNLNKYTLLERDDIHGRTTVLADKLKRYGLIFNTADTGGMRAALGPYYARWKNEFGAAAWSALEAAVGKRG